MTFSELKNLGYRHLTDADSISLLKKNHNTFLCNVADSFLILADKRKNIKSLYGVYGKVKNCYVIELNYNK